MATPAGTAGEAKGGTHTFHTPESTVRDYLRVVSTRRWVVLSAFLMVVLAAGLWVFTQTPIYRSQAVLQIRPGSSSVAPFRGVVDEGVYAVAPRNSFVETQMSLVVSDRIVEQTFNHFGIGKRPAYSRSKDPLGRFKRLFDVSSIRRTWLVRVSFEWPDAKQGARILDHHVAAYATDYRQRRGRMAKEGLAYLEKERDAYEPRVRTARAKLQEFREEHRSVAFDRERSTISAGLLARKRAEEAAREKLSEITTRLTQIEKATKDNTSLEDLSDVLENQLIRDYRREKLKCAQILEQRLEDYGEKHPEIRALRAQLELITKNIHIEIGRVLEGVKKDHAAAKELVGLCVKEKMDFEGEVQQFSKLNLEYQALKTGFENLEAVYKKVIERVEEIKITSASVLKGDTVSVEAPPKVEVSPAKPRKVLVMFLASLLGLTVGIGLAFLLDSLDTTLKSKDDVARHLGLNLLGYVPEIPELRGAKRAHSQAALAMLRHPRSAAAEAFRSVRTALSFSVAAQEVSHVMVTSASPSEGKTLVAVNLAAAIAQTGKRVLLVDGDMRKPAVHKVFEAEQSPGLTNLLVDEGAGGPRKLEDVVRPAEIPNLFYLPCGPIPPNPAELIGCDRMNALLADMLAAYDRVIIDTPPVVNVTDAAVLCGTAQGVVLVVRSFRSQRDLARRAVEILATSGGRLLGAVLNNVDVPRGAYYYDGYYYYRQYYYYSEDGDKKKKKRKKKRKKRESDTHKATA